VNGKQLTAGGQTFDLRFDFFLCPTHGLLMPSRFSADWTTDDSCPVLDAAGETCDGWLTPVFLDSLEPTFRADERAKVLEEVRAELTLRADRLAATIGMASVESELRAHHEEQALRAAIGFLDSLSEPNHG
jgi:hypothetical protein